MTGVGIRIEGSGEALALIGAIAERLDDPTPMYAQMGAYGVTSTSRRFELGVGPDGNPWPPSLRALAEGGKTLIKSARLFGSLTFNAAAGGVEWGTNVIYAAVHQLGYVFYRQAHLAAVHFKTHKRTGKTLRGFRKAAKANVHQEVYVPAHLVQIPARPFLGIDDGDTVELLRIAERYVGGAEVGP